MLVLKATLNETILKIISYRSKQSITHLWMHLFQVHKDTEPQKQFGSSSSNGPWNKNVRFQLREIVSCV